MSAVSSTLVQSMSWIERLVIGPFTVSLAAIAIAVIGLLMLRGHVPLEATFRIVGGCFIIFGAPAIALGIIDAAQDVAKPKAAKVATGLAAPSKPSAVYDPYAGAATPVH